MSEKIDTIQPIVLAAGKGARMNGGDLPKVLVPLKGKPMISYLLESVEKSRLTRKPIIVVGHHALLVRETLGPLFQYAEQTEQRGTGHAVLSAHHLLKNNARHIMVLYGDHPLVDTETIDRLAMTHGAIGNSITMATVVVEDFDDWKTAFMHYGRIVRDAHGNIVRIVEYKDATEDERKITEVNPSYFCFRADWLWKNLPLIQNNNQKGEFYLTDLIGIATKEKIPIATIAIEPKTALGANTKEELQILEGFLT